jgi:hypothetical protein
VYTHIYQSINLSLYVYRERNGERERKKENISMILSLSENCAEVGEEKENGRE